jgi:hypothetical protein
MLGRHPDPRLVAGRVIRVPLTGHPDQFRPLSAAVYFSAWRSAITRFTLARNAAWLRVPLL